MSSTWFDPTEVQAKLEDGIGSGGLRVVVEEPFHEYMTALCQL